MKTLIYYLVNRKHINDYYNLALENGDCTDETYNWKQRTAYFKRYMTL
jgi:hypothetical protein